MAEARYEGFLPGRHAIDAYGAGGFRFAGMSHRGSLLLLPSGIKAWTASEGEPWSSRQFEDVFAEAAAIDLLLVGTGSELRPIPEAVRWRFREHGVGVEPMATGPAARTYNVLVAEGRKVAAALVAVA